MLEYRRQEREVKKMAREQPPRAKYSGHNTSKKIKNGDVQQQQDSNQINWEVLITTANLLPNEIPDADPFEVFPIKIEPYMLDFLSFCEY